ncbi:MAG: acetamidase/formamidase family protein [Chloroflexi bacterium]|nr:acetamidase/formamidase family protein [Chloroflexota bacterium]MCI0580365.1 acetamidase/formamidase family protein [Chloroflexota bacterium]MCI0649523.1 acetamidase/formamidase family protein [Chloroflexota bacterium]MCI0726054.1 acetamidase/formamidase family protein [Chloroflexota bacterium]
MATYVIEPDEQTLHGFFSPELPPILTIESGDTVRFRTLDADWGLEPFTEFLPSGPAPRRQATTKVGGPMGHALCGPVAIRGAEPGMALAVRIDGLRPGAWGWTWAGGELVEGEVMHFWELDGQALRGRNQHGHTVLLRPFMGVMGMPPAEPGQHSTTPPRATGGNIDCKELVAGSTLYLPVAVPGGLFSVGDGHALQGDGEVSRTAIECPMDEVTLTFELRDDLCLATPRARTPAGWLTFGFAEDLDVATQIALDAMLDLMAGQYGLARVDALALASLVVDLRVTQIVNQVRGIHALLPHGAIQFD